MARRASASASATIPKSFFEKECQEYIALLLALGEEEVMKIDTLQWWADVGIYKFPTLARIAIRILCAQPTSAETKRVFSVSGRVLNEARSRLTSSHVKQIVCLHSWLKEKQSVPDLLLYLSDWKPKLLRMTFLTKITRTIVI